MRKLIVLGVVLTLGPSCTLAFPIDGLETQTADAQTEDDQTEGGVVLAEPTPQPVASGAGRFVLRCNTVEYEVAEDVDQDGFVGECDPDPNSKQLGVLAMPANYQFANEPDIGNLIWLAHPTHADAKLRALPSTTHVMLWATANSDKAYHKAGTPLLRHLHIGLPPDTKAPIAPSEIVQVQEFGTNSFWIEHKASGLPATEPQPTTRCQAAISDGAKLYMAITFRKSLTPEARMIVTGKITITPNGTSPPCVLGAVSQYDFGDKLQLQTVGWDLRFDNWTLLKNVP